MNKTELVAGYVEKYGANFPNLTLARIVYNENVWAFKDVEDARRTIRNVLGKSGRRERKKLSSKYGHLYQEKDKPKNPYALPESWAESKRIFKLPVGCNNIGFISDAQVPFHSSQAIETAYAYLKERGVNTIFINGDWIDFYHLSNFQKDPKRRDFEQEYYAILQSLEHMRHHFPDITIYYNLDANHEMRYERFMSIKAPELMSIHIPDFTLESFLKLSAFNIIPLRGNHHIMIGKLPVVHGHTIFKGQVSPVSTARTLWMKAKQSAIASHCHQVNEHTVTAPFTGEIHTCWTTGCLMSLNVEYNQHGHNYSHGFAHITTEKDGSYSVNNKRIFNGRVL